MLGNGEVIFGIEIELITGHTCPRPTSCGIEVSCAVVVGADN